jgi:shikimate dehydrogenase
MSADPARSTEAPRAGVVGWPIEHSRSPIIHNYWLAELGIPGSYVGIAVRPEDAPAFFRDFAASGLVGCNVTVPLKEIAAAACDVLDPVADAVQAANTLWLDNGTLVGANTDAGGFLANLDEGAPGWDRDKGHAVVIGAGGAARAVAYGLHLRGFEPISVVNRTVERASAVAALVHGARARGFEALPGLLADARVLVNTTSLGMTGQPRLDIDLAPLPRSALVTDVVYIPLETELLSSARARGNPVVDGIGMLLHQAVPGFARWFGRRPQVTPELRALVLRSLSAT